MKLSQHQAQHMYIGDEYERITNSWTITLEENDFDARIRERFAEILVDQTYYTNKPEEVEPRTTFRGTRTNWFGIEEKKDKQKKLIIEEVAKFIHNHVKTNPLMCEWVF
jgi:hypothetical protein